mmetsp:Transcript_122642/g.243976  ORF Transcript_122642/g.243976 Transcript_122642/m.243976 type:complete len:160 (-) Transcript_122642:73-552(-)
MGAAQRIGILKKGRTSREEHNCLHAQIAAPRSRTTFKDTAAQAASRAFLSRFANFLLCRVPGGRRVGRDLSAWTLDVAAAALAAAAPSQGGGMGGAPGSNAGACLNKDVCCTSSDATAKPRPQPTARNTSKAACRQWHESRPISSVWVAAVLPPAASSS